MYFEVHRHKYVGKLKFYTVMKLPIETNRQTDRQTGRQTTVIHPSVFLHFADETAISGKSSLRPECPLDLLSLHNQISKGHVVCTSITLHMTMAFTVCLSVTKFVSPRQWGVHHSHIIAKCLGY